MIGIDKLLTVRIFTTIQMATHLFGTTCNDIVQCPVVTGQHAGAEAVDVIRSIAAEYIRQFDQGASKIAHQLIDGFDGSGLCFFRQMCINTGRGWGAMAQPSLDQA